MKRVIALALMASAFVMARPARGQTPGPSRIDAGGNLQVGGEAERYLRVLEVAGIAPQQPWTVRPLLMAPTLPAGHPWREHWTIDSTGPDFQWRWLRPGARVALNTTFPFEVIQGPAWAGRGFTTQVEGGLVATWGRFRAQVEPTVFVSQNAAFALAPNGLSGDGARRDVRYPEVIDAPQRFGTGPYARLDPGNTTLSIDLSPVVIGFSTAPQSWGPAREFPLVLSASSGGFAHAFVATRTPVDLWFARVHGRLIAGTIGSSGNAPPVSPSGHWASGIALTLLPRGLDGLELGLARFINGLSASGIPTPGDVLRVFRTEFRVAHDDLLDENQVASGYFRWAVPKARIEVYGEYYREDYAVELRRLLQYPDDYATYVLGLQHVRDLGGGHLRAYRFEVLNGEMSSSNRRERGTLDSSGYVLTRPQPPYVHSTVAYGHTNRGMFLGSPEAYGGAAWRAGIDDYDARGRSTLTLERRLRFDWLPGTPASVMPRPDVIFSLRAERMRFVGDREYGVTIIPMIDLNRNLRPGHDAFNLSAAVSVRGFR